MFMVVFRDLCVILIVSTIVYAVYRTIVKTKRRTEITEAKEDIEEKLKEASKIPKYSEKEIDKANEKIDKLFKIRER